MFVDAVKHVIEDEQLITSDCGQKVLQVLNYVKMNSDSPPIQEIIATIHVYVLVSSRSCISKSDRCKLPSSIASRIWPAFHEMHISTDLHHVWKTHLTTLGCHTSERFIMLALQVVLDQLIKQMIEMKYRSGQATSAQCPPVAITEREVKVVTNLFTSELTYVRPPRSTTL